jgi:hypothetical protein
LLNEYIAIHGEELGRLLFENVYGVLSVAEPKDDE